MVALVMMTHLLTHHSSTVRHFHRGSPLAELHYSDMTSRGSLQVLPAAPHLRSSLKPEEERLQMLILFFILLKEGL